MAAIVSRPQWVKPSGAETGGYQANFVDAIIIDALAPWFASSSSNKVSVLRNGMKCKFDAIFCFKKNQVQFIDASHQN